MEGDTEALEVQTSIEKGADRSIWLFMDSRIFAGIIGSGRCPFPQTGVVL